VSTALDAPVEELARSSAIDAAEDAAMVGAIESVDTDADGFTHVRFECKVEGYRGWHWTVVLTEFEGTFTVCESYLLPGDDALLGTPWVPWSDRVRPGDLDAAMVLPYIAEDPRLVPGYTAAVGDDVDELEIFEFGLGRERVLAPEGRDAAAERWHRGSHGPTAASAVISTAQCSTCAFFIPLTGSMRLAFGACSNEWSPSDGRVVSVDHGCGAHSQTDAERRTSEWPAPDPIVDSGAMDALDLNAPDEPDAPEAPEEPTPDAAEVEPEMSEPVTPQDDHTHEAPQAEPDSVTDASIEGASDQEAELGSGHDFGEDPSSEGDDEGTSLV
jgi:hypothetical protein